MSSTARSRLACTSGEPAVEAVGADRPARRRRPRTACRERLTPNRRRTEEDPADEVVVVGTEPDRHQVGVLVDGVELRSGCRCRDLRLRSGGVGVGAAAAVVDQVGPGRLGDPVRVVDARPPAAVGRVRGPVPGAAV